MLVETLGNHFFHLDSMVPHSLLILIWLIWFNLQWFSYWKEDIQSVKTRITLEIRIFLFLSEC